MAKKKERVDYDKESLKALAKEIKRVRKPIKDGEIPDLEIDEFSLEETVKKLPEKERRNLEKFWGLVPGTVKWYKMYATRMQKDQSVKNMVDFAWQTIEKLISIESLYWFDRNARKLVDNFVAKIDKTGFETIPDIDALNYLMLFLVFLVGGPQMAYESEEFCLTRKEEELGCFDKYALLNATYENTGCKLPDKSINLRLLVNVIEMFDLKDVITMKRYVGLPIPREYSDIQTEPMECFWHIRMFKEKIFSNGAWDITMLLIYNQGVSKLNLNPLEKKMKSLSSDWSTISKFEKGTSRLKTATIEKEYTLYKIGALQFTDLYEIQTLYLLRNYL